MGYSLGGFDLLQGGTIPIRTSDSNIALTGFMDMPARIGTTEYNWAEQYGVEPYVSSGEIFFGGRDLVLNLLITGDTPEECNDRFWAIHSHVDGLTDLAPLVTPYGTYQVYVNAPIVGEYMPDAGSLKGIRMTLPMREPVAAFTGTTPGVGSSEFGIDGISFASLGGEMITLEGDRRNRAAPKGETASVYGREGALINKRVAGELMLKVAIKQPTIEEVQDRVADLAALLAAPGLRSLTVNHDKMRSFFVKDGFKATKVYTGDDFSFALIEVKLTESGQAIPLQSLIDSLGDTVLDKDGNTIKIRV